MKWLLLGLLVITLLGGDMGLSEGVEVISVGSETRSFTMAVADNTGIPEWGPWSETRTFTTVADKAVIPPPENLRVR